MKFESKKLWIFQDNDINTDLIFPGKHTYKLLKSEEMAQYAMEDYDPSFAKEAENGDMIITGSNFGCGSSREQAVKCLKHAGISVIIAKSYSRLFYRNSINSALPVIISPNAVDYIFSNKEKVLQEKIAINMENGTLFVGQKEFSFPKLDAQALKIFSAGGLAEYTKLRLEK